MTNSYCVPSFLARNQNFFVLSLSLSLAIDTMNNNECKLRRQTCLIKCSLISITRQLFPERALNYEWKNMSFYYWLVECRKGDTGNEKRFSSPLHNFPIVEERENQKEFAAHKNGNEITKSVWKIKENSLRCCRKWIKNSLCLPYSHWALSQMKT